jgi:hypothetical protein
MLEKNLGVLVKVNPYLTAKIKEIKENKKFEVFLDEKDRLNYNIYDTDNNEFFYKNSPIKTVIEDYNNIEKIYSRYPYLYFYGLGNGVLIKLLLNRKNLERIIVIEPDIELFYIVFNLLDFTEEIESGKIIFEHSEDFSFIKADKYMEGNVKIYAKLYTLQVANSYYYKYYSSDITRVNKIFVRAITHIVTSIGNSATDTLIGLKHHISNLPFMLKTPTLKDSIKKYKNSKNVVIVSTGPSLNKQLELLKKYQDYITIFCVDASLPILQEHKIRPDVVFSLERVEATAKFYENLDKEFLKDTIFEITSIAHKKLLEKVSDMKVQMSMRPFEFLKYFGFREWGYLGFGMSAANMAFECAFLAGFENIALIGQDLSYSKDGKSHSKGHTFGENEVEISSENDFLIDGYYGDKVITNKIWNLFLNFFEKHILQAREEGIVTYNCTEGGVRISGANHMSFAEFLSNKVNISKKKSLVKLTQNNNYEKNIKLAHKKVKDLLEYTENVQKKVENTFLSVMETIENLEVLNKENRLEEITFDMLNETIDKIDNIKTIYESEEFALVFYEVTMSFILHEEMELAKIMVKNAKTDDEKKAKMIDWIYEHKSWLFFLAGGIDSFKTVVKESYKEWANENI